MFILLGKSRIKALSNFCVALPGGKVSGAPEDVMQSCQIVVYFFYIISLGLFFFCLIVMEIKI